MTALEWSWGDSPLMFLPQRALWRAEGRELFVADLHLGKAEVFQAHGIPMPSDGDQGTLNPLLDLCNVWSPQRLFVLGDLVHARTGITALLRETLLALPDLCLSLIHI